MRSLKILKEAGIWKKKIQNVEKTKEKIFPGEVDATACDSRTPVVKMPENVTSNTAHSEVGRGPMWLDEV